MNIPAREEALFQAAVQLGAAERAAYLDHECAGDPALRKRLEALLAAHDQPDTLFGTQAGGARPTISLDLAHDLADDLVGQTIGRYKLREKIGEGGCGVVYVAEQTEPVRRRVALKIIKLGMDTKQVVARFEAERQALAMMDHPNIAKVLDAGVVGQRSDIRGQRSEVSDQRSAGGVADALTSDFRPLTSGSGRPYFVMELVRGIKITDYCDQERLSTRERLDLFIKVCQAIQHAHQKGIIHRDIKPSNILVTLHDGVPVPKVIDFGIAKAIEGRLTDATVYTQLHQFIGTPAYMSPEQAEMSGLDLDTRSDIYSLGVLLYELLTGVPPFDAKELMSQGIDTMRRTIREQEPVRPSTRLRQSALAAASGGTSRLTDHGSRPTRPASLSTDLDWIVMKCLEKDRGRRYETANGLAADLKRHLNHEPVIARPPSAVYRFQKSWRRNRLAYGAAVVVVVSLLAGIVTSGWQLRVVDRARQELEQAWFAEKQQRQVAQEERDRAAQAERAAEVRRQEAEEAHAKAEAARQAAALERDRAARLFARSRAEQGIRRLESGDPAGLWLLLEARRAIAHLPDERVAYTRLWNAWYEDLPSRESLTLPTTNRLRCVAFSLAGRGLLTGAEDGEVVHWDTSTRRRLATIASQVPYVSSLEMSAEGHLLMISNGPETQLWELAAPESRSHPQRLVTDILHFAFDPTRRRVVLLVRRQPPGSITANEEPRRQVEIWESGPEPRRVAIWPDDRQELVNHRFALSPDGTTVATLGDSLNFWDGRNGGRLSPVQEGEDSGQPTGASWVFFSPNGRWLWAIQGHLCQRYEVGTWRRLGEPFRGQFHFPGEGRAEGLLAVEQAGATRLLHLDSAEYLAAPIHREAAYSHPFLSADGRRLASEGPSGSIRFWEVRTGEPAAPPVFLPLPTAARALSPNGEWLAAITSDGVGRLHQVLPRPSAAFLHRPGVRVVGFNAAGARLEFDVHRRSFRWIGPDSDTVVGEEGSLREGASLLGVALHPESRELLTSLRVAGGGVLIEVLDSTSFQVLRRFRGPTLATHLALSSDGKSLAGVAGETGTIQVWDLAAGEVQQELRWPGAPEFEWFGLDFSPDGRCLAVRNIHGFAIWSLPAGRLGNGKTWDFHTAISPDWKLAFARNGLINLRDPLQPRPAEVALPDEALQNSGGIAAFSPEGRQLALAMTGNRLRVYDTASGRATRLETQVSGQIYHVGFSPDGRLLVTHEIDLRKAQDGDRSVRLWEATTGLPLGRPQPASGFLSQWRFDPAGRVLCVGRQPEADSSDSWIWRLPRAEPPRGGMEALTCLTTTCRLDETGNPVLLTPAEIHQIESSLGGALSP